MSEGGTRFVFRTQNNIALLMQSYSKHMYVIEWHLKEYKHMYRPACQNFSNIRYHLLFPNMSMTICNLK